MAERSLTELRALVVSSGSQLLEMITEAFDGMAPRVRVVLAETRGAFGQALEAFGPCVVVFDNDRAPFDTPEALRLTREWRPECPFLLIADVFEGSAAASLKAGAEGIVCRHDLSRLRLEVTEAVRLRAPLRRLSARQREVMQLLASGCSTRAIAERLGLSVKTIETHRAEMMSRLGMTDIASLVRYAVQVRLVAPLSQGSLARRGPRTS